MSDAGVHVRLVRSPLGQKGRGSVTPRSLATIELV
jgi:hypothetical protein